MISVLYILEKFQFVISKKIQGKLYQQIVTYVLNKGILIDTCYYFYFL